MACVEVIEVDRVWSLRLAVTTDTFLAACVRGGPATAVSSFNPGMQVIAEVWGRTNSWWGIKDVASMARAA